MKYWKCSVCGYWHSGDKAPESCPACGSDFKNFETAEKQNLGEAETIPEKIIIIGNGAAGVEAAKAIREISKSVEIKIFSREKYHFYSRIHLSSFIGEELSMDDLFVQPADWYSQNNICVKLNTTVSKIEVKNKRILDHEGNFYQYDRLILATGARPYLPEIFKQNSESVIMLRQLDDALKILKKAKTVKSALIVGGGILGVEAASALNKLGLQVTLAEISDHLMPAQLDAAGSEVLESILKGRGLKFRLAAHIKNITDKGGSKIVEFQDGKTLKTEMILVSAGITPDTKLAKDAGLLANRGIVVDEKLETSFPGVFAAGDAAEYKGSVFGIWPAAVEQGEIAGKNSMGSDLKYEGTMPLHILKVAGIDLTSIGIKYPQIPQELVIQHQDPDEGKYIKLIHNKEHLLGAIVLGHTGLGFRIERFIKGKNPIAPILNDLADGNWSVFKKKLKKVSTARI